jgi:26S proteasome regulatory subunit N2
LQYASFAPESRYQPVRIIATKTAPVRATKAAKVVPPEKYAGGGGILILADTRPSEEEDFMESVLEPLASPSAAASGTASTGPAASARHIALDEVSPEAEPPETFEVSFGYSP